MFFVFVFCCGVCVGVFTLSAIFESRQNVDPEIKPEQKRAAAVKFCFDTAHMVSDDNTDPVLYMTTARQHQTSQPQRTVTQTHQRPIRRQKKRQVQAPL